MMPNKALRILIADEHHVQLMQVEKMLNQLGYYRVAPVQSFDELLALIQCAIEPFDLLIANTELAARVGVDLPRFCKSSPQIHHTMLYENRHVEVPLIAPEQRQAVSVCLARLPDTDALKTLMEIVDAPQGVPEAPVSLAGHRSHAKRRVSHHREPAFIRHS
jgi:CheY-like chemotaxis protein